MRNSCYRLYSNKFSYIIFGSTVFIFLILSVTTGSSGYASNDVYDSGYDHGCSDAEISNPNDRYLNQPEKGPSFHTDTFVLGYNDGFDACSKGTNDNLSSSSSSSSSKSESGSTSSHSGFFTEHGFVVQSQSDRPAVNENFNPDRSCMFDAYQLRCIPGATQECPEGFGNNEDSTCFFLHREGCPEGYHSTDDDETGQCYSNEEGCNAYVTINGTRHDYVLLTDRSGKGDVCADPRYFN